MYEIFLPHGQIRSVIALWNYAEMAPNDALKASKAAFRVPVHATAPQGHHVPSVLHFRISLFGLSGPAQVIFKICLVAGEQGGLSILMFNISRSLVVLPERKI